MPSESDLVGRFNGIYRENMRGLPICNPALKVEAVGFEAMSPHRLGVLITPWFMNLVLLPGDDGWAAMPYGAKDEVSLPAEPCEFTICRDETLGVYLSAILFRSVSDFPDQQTAVRVATEVLQQLRTPVPPKAAARISRRTLLGGMSTG